MIPLPGVGGGAPTTQLTMASESKMTVQELRTRLKARSSRISQSRIFGISRVLTLMETLND